MNLIAITASLSIQLLLYSSSVVASSVPKPWIPCTIHSPNTGSYFDLNPISLSSEVKDGYDDDRTESWHAKGYDYPANFTINFCAPVMEELDNVVGVDKELWKNVSAYYQIGDDIYSIGYVGFLGLLLPYRPAVLPLSLELRGSRYCEIELHAE